MKNFYLLSLTLLLAIFSACKETPLEPEPDITNVTVINDVSDSLSIANQLASLNEAGAFYNVNMKILDGTSPIEGAEVKLTSSANGAIIETVSTSDANGNVVFDGVTIGGNIIEVSKEGYYSALGLIEFKFERGYNYEMIDETVAPITRNESAIIPLYNAENSSQTAEIKGRVIIETDLTNENAETVSNQLIKADFSGNIAQVSEGINFQAYSLNVEGGLGEATTNQNGEFNLVIPTGNEGVSVSLMIPELRLKQKLAFYDNAAEAYVLDSLEATFSFNRFASSIPFISGVKATIPAPEAAGRGFQINNVQKAGRPLFNYYGGSYYPNEDGEIQSGNQFNFSFTRGEGYKSRPSAIITDETGSGAELLVKMQHAIKSVTLDSVGELVPNSYLEMRIVAYSSYDYNPGNSYSNTISYLSFQTDTAGQISQAMIDNELEYSFQYSNWYGENYSAPYSGRNLDSMVVEFFSYSMPVTKLPSATVNYDSRVSRIEFLNAGQNYLNPSITFQGGEPSTPAQFVISDYQTPWSFELDNSANTTPYVMTPEITIEHFDGTNYQIENRITNQASSSIDINNELISENGQIKFPNDSTYKTYVYSLQPPTFYIAEPTHEQASINVTVNSNSEIQLYPNYYYNINSGRGYKNKFEISIEPRFESLPGADAKVLLIGGTQVGDEYKWGGDLILQNPGFGYQASVNKVYNERNFNMSYNISELFLKAGESLIVDIDYGTGYRPQN